MRVSDSLLNSIQGAYHAVVPAQLRLALYRVAPDALRRHLDRWGARLYEQPLTLQTLRLPKGPYGPARWPRRVNKLCDETDWRDEEWLSLFDALGEAERRTQMHRKAWEWVQGLYALRQLGLLHEEATALGVGAGSESILYYLANQIKMVTATDIYGEGDFVDSTAQASMLSDPASFARIPYRQDHLTVLHMDGLNLDFPDNTFDFAFSFSSIEHFGGHAAAAQAVREMGRVVKPGGVVIITSEVILNGFADEEFFLPRQIQEYLIDGSGLVPIEPIDYTLSAQTLEHIVNEADPHYATTLPHIVIRGEWRCYTSFCLVQQKPRSESSTPGITSRP